MTNTIRKIAICLIPAILTATGLFALNTDAVAKTEIVEPSYVSSAPAITEAVYTEAVKEATDTAPVVEQTEIPAEIEQVKTEGFVKSSSARIDPVVEAPVKEKNAQKDNAPAPVAEQTVVDAFVMTETVNSNNSASFSGDGSASVPVTVTVEPTEEYSDPEPDFVVEADDDEDSEPAEVLYTDDEFFKNIYNTSNRCDKVDQIVDWHTDYSEDTYTAFAKALSFVPDIVIEKLSNLGLRWNVLSDADFAAGNHLGMGAAGYCDYCLGVRNTHLEGSRLIGDVEYNDGGLYFLNNADTVMYSLCHETGHALAEYCATYNYDENTGFCYRINADRTNEWLAIYYAEAENISEYACTNSVECFAEAFQRYCADPETLRSVAPMAYEYLDNLVDSLYNVDYTKCEVDINTVKGDAEWPTEEPTQ